MTHDSVNIMFELLLKYIQIHLNLYFGANWNCHNVYLYFFYTVLYIDAQISITTTVTRTEGGLPVLI